jgi:hypothetical protein
MGGSICLKLIVGGGVSILHPMWVIPINPQTTMLILPSISIKMRETYRIDIDDIDDNQLHISHISQNWYFLHMSRFGVNDIDDTQCHILHIWDI